MRRKTFLTPLLYFIAFLVRAHNFAEYINSTTVFLHSKYSNVASVRKKCSKCVLKFIEPARLSPYQLMVVAKATRQSPHYFTQYFQVMSRILNLKCCRFNIFRPTIGLADDLHKKSHQLRRLLCRRATIHEWVVNSRSSLQICLNDFQSFYLEQKRFQPVFVKV